MCLRQTVHTHRATVHQAAKLIARVTAGPAESNDSLPPGLWLTSPAGWLPRTGISSGTLCSVIEYGLPIPLRVQPRGWAVCSTHSNGRICWQYVDQWDTYHMPHSRVQVSCSFRSRSFHSARQALQCHGVCSYTRPSSYCSRSPSPSLCWLRRSCTLPTYSGVALWLAAFIAWTKLTHVGPG